MVVESADGTGWEAMEQGQVGDPQSTAGVWKKLTVPPGIKATPIMAESTIALVYQGKQIEEVAAFAGQIRGWSTQRLRKPVQDDLVPIVGPHYALYQAGNDLYAFSSAAGGWDVLSLPEGAKAEDRASCSLTSWSCKTTSSTFSTSRPASGQKASPSSCPRNKRSTALR